MGAVLALRMAASARAAAIAGLDISGLPFVFDEALADKQQLAGLDFLPDNSREYRRALFYGPDGTFDADMIAAEERLIRPIPAGARGSRAAGPCSRHRRESNSPGSGPAVTT
jgi:hypothetical protein